MTQTHFEGPHTHRPLLLTRGNVDGIISAAIAINHDTKTKPVFVPHSVEANKVLRADLTHSKVTFSDLALTQELVKTISRRFKDGIEFHVVDHHQQSLEHAQNLPVGVGSLVKQGMSASALLYEYLQVNPNYEYLAALADEADQVHGPCFDAMVEEHGLERIQHEAEVLDHAWRFDLHDDAFRHITSRRLALGYWPSEIPEVMRRYQRMEAGGYWQKATKLIRNRMKVHGHVGLLDTSRLRQGLHGFGAKALSHVAREMGAEVACKYTRRRTETTLSLRRTEESNQLNLGAFVKDFTRAHGVNGGGHPEAAGGRVPVASTRDFLSELVCVA